MVSAHREARTAFYDAFEQVRRVAAQHGNRVPEPYIPGPLPPPRTPPGVGSGSPQALTALSTELTRAAGAWESSARVLSGILAGLALPTTPARTISGAARRVSSQKADVERRRAELLKAEQQITQNAITGVRTFLNTPKRKPPLQAAWDAQFHHFLPGVATGTKDLTLYGLANNPMTAPFYFAANRDSWMNRGPVGQAKMIYQAVQHPGLFLKSIVDWEQWKTDPMRAYGETVPSLIAAATMGTGAGSGITARFSTLLRRHEQKPETPAADTRKSDQSLNEAAEEAPKTRDLGNHSRGGGPAATSPTQPPGPAPRPNGPPEDIRVAGKEPDSPKPQPPQRTSPGHPPSPEIPWFERRAAEIGAEIKKLPRGSGKPDRLAEALTKLGLPHDEAVRAAVKAAESAFGEVGGTPAAVGGGTVILPKIAAQNIVLIVRPDGSVVAERGNVIDFIAR
ncbi:hypothetical protein [Spirillospora albida]|uniref:hypothetical protein n=1 Tax=Spirillospora albida TaxID=58123 RepID=UPI0004C2A4DC|nr:hypothetical protein [Spirillospora albida]